VQRICVYCGANAGRQPAYETAAIALGESLAQRRIGLVYGGGGTGLMGAVARGVMNSGGDVTGIIPKALYERELADESITTLEVVGDMHERKARMASLSDAFIAMPGGIGTMEELFEAMTWSQLGFQNKQCGLLNVAGYYDALVEFLDHAGREGFIRDGLDSLLSVSPDPAQLIDELVKRNESS